jgi:hypothetical protein
MKRPLRWLASLLHLRRRVRFVAWILPNRYWYRAALTISRLQGALNGALGGNRTLTEAVMLDHWLWELTAIGPFPVPYICNGVDVFKTANSKIGTLYCWIHEPLVEFLLRPFIELGNTEPMIVADRGRIVDGDRFMVTGTKLRLMAFPADKYALGRAKRSLQAGMSVVCLADAYIGGRLYAYVLQLVGRVGARVVFSWATRRPDGVIEVTFMNAPRPYCETEEAVRENLAFLQAAQQRALRTLGLPERKTT